MRAERSPAIWLALALLWGCSDAVTPSPGPDARTPSNPSDRDLGVITTPDSGLVRDASLLGGFMDPCLDNTDCESGWCLESGDRRLCTVLCFDEGCPEDWSCRVVENTWPDVVSLCLPPDAPQTEALCRPCTEDGACPGGACYTLGGDQVCGLDCVEDAHCPTGYECRAVLEAGRPRQCVPSRLTCPEPDAGVPDMGVADAAALDAEIPDAEIPDAEIPDAEIPDAEIPDAAVPDEGLPDMMIIIVPDAEVPDAEIPDAEIPDAAVPDEGLPDMMIVIVPDAEIPDAEIPDAEIPDAEIPDAEIPDMAVPRLGYGEPCDAASQCESEICVQDPIRGGGVCSLTCADAGGCPGLDTCLPVEGGQGVCFRNETGEPCLDAGDCVEGLCVTPPDPSVPWVSVQRICASRCEDDRRCPSGFGCEVIESNQGPVRACVPDVRRVAQCQDGFRDFCLGSGLCQIPQGRDPLDVYLCINVPDNLGRSTDGYCSCTCGSAADCPEGYGCMPAPALSGDPSRPGICMPISGYRCAGQAANLVSDQCLSLACMDPGPTPNAAYCTLFCEDGLDCPSGYRCAQEGGDRICVPIE